MSAEKIPLVSVIIPMFNAEKFISQTLESLLYQTMKDFEVVIVDDCSTDNGVEVVESFKPRFNSSGVKLHVIKLPKNTGTPGLPRNVGIQFACGKYIAFLDSDDLYTKTALEELSTLAEKFQADVVHTERTHILWNGKKKSVDDPAFTDMNELLKPENFSFKTFRRSKSSLPAEPVFETPNLVERLNRWLNWDYDWSTCTIFCRRNFLIAKQIYFSSMKTSEDVPFGFECLFRAEKYLRVPNVTYIIRPRSGSISRERDKISVENDLLKRIGAFNDGFNELEKIFDKIKFFNKYPKCRYAVLHWFASFRLPITQNLFKKFSVVELNDFVKKTFHPDDAALAAYLFNTVNIQQIQIMRLQQDLAKFQNQR